MKPTKRLKRDFKAIEQPAGSYPFGKNGIWNGNTEALQNEPGFAVSSSVIPYTFLGKVQTDGDPIIFSGNGVFSAFGFYNQEKDIYTPIINDATLNYKLGFRLDKYIIGEARRNYKNNIEVAWLDKFNPLRFADTVNPPTSLTGYLLFPEYTEPDVELEITNGGNLLMGAYYTALRYSNNDGTETRYSTPSGPIFATAVNFAALPGTGTGKSLKISISDLDLRYNKFQLAVIRKINGIVTAVELPEVSINSSGTALVNYSGTEGDDITLEEVLIPGAFYNNADSITQINDILYLAGMKEADVYNLQKYANLVQIKWKSDLRLNIESDDAVKSGKIRTFKHGEAYGFYIVYKFTNGRVTNAFHVPGPPPIADNLVVDPVGNDQGFTAKKYQADTVGLANINMADRTGRTGVWVNEDEVYPNDASFNSSDIGGEDLRGTKVRHHKMPTLNQTLNLFYSGLDSSGFGINGLDALGISAENIVIPVELQGQIESYEIYYAKRDYSNSTILSQGLVIYGATSTYTNKDVYFTGGNFHSRMLRSDFSSTDFKREMHPTSDVFKLHHPDLMINRPAISPNFLASNYKLQTPIGFANVVKNSVDELNFIADYTKAVLKTKAYIIKGIKNTGYLLNNGIRGLIKNIKSEDGFVGSLFVAGASNLSIDVSNLIHGGRDTEGSVKPPDFEQAHLVDAVVLKRNMYQSFNTQDLVRTGISNPVDISLPSEFSFNGDCFLVVHSYWSYGVVESLDRFPTNPGRVDGVTGDDEDTYTDEFFLGTSGNKVARKYVTESATNMWQRYVDPAIPESKFWPASPLETLNGMNRNRDNNVISIVKDSSAIGDLLNGIKTFNYEQVNIIDSPYKIIRSKKQSKEGKINSWKNYNALDYYEADKNMGPIVNIQGYDDRLIIHHRNALFITQDKTTLQGDILSVTLGSGDIFRFPPKQGKPSSTGYAGTQHQLACTMTDFGYVFPDAEVGMWFVLNDKGLNEINSDMYNFFESYLNVKEINPYVGNGIIVGFDKDYGRLLVTVKNSKLPAGVKYVPNYEATQEFFNQLVPGQSVVFKDGRYQLFLGVNTSQFDCDECELPTISNQTFNINELSPTGTIVGTVVGTSDTPSQFLIIAGNTSNAFQIDSITGKLVVLNPNLNYDDKSVYLLEVRISNTCGSDIAVITVNLNSMPQPPTAPDYEIDVLEGSPTNMNLLTVAGMDPRSNPITYGILSQTATNAVKIDPSSGLVRINNASQFFLNVNTTILVQVTVASSGGSAISNIKINIVKELVVYKNTTVSDSVRRQCSPGEIGTLVTMTVPANTFESYKSVQDANNQALEYLASRLQDYANNPINGGVCNPAEVGNDAITRVFTKTCPTGFAGSTHSFTVAANIHFGTTKQIANDKALAEVLVLGQAFADSEPSGVCTPIEVGNDERRRIFTKDCSELGPDYTGTAVEYVVLKNTFFGPSKANANMQAEMRLDSYGQTYANLHGDCIPPDGTVYWNVYVEGTFYSDECGEDYVALPIVVSIPAHSFSGVTQLAADNAAEAALALLGPTVAAEDPNSCEQVVFWNTYKSGYFTRNNCTPPLVGTQVFFFIPAHTYSAPTQLEADADAQQALEELGQEQANTIGNCETLNYFTFQVVIYGDYANVKYDPADSRGLSFRFINTDVVTVATKLVSTTITRNSVTHTFSIPYIGTTVNLASVVCYLKTVSLISGGTFTTKLLHNSVTVGTQTITLSAFPADLEFAITVPATVETEINSSSVLRIEHGSGAGPTVYYSAPYTGYATKNNCPSGQTPVGSVALTATSGQFTSSISQTDANNQAIAWVNANKQANANTYGTCSGSSGCDLVLTFASKADESTVGANDGSITVTSSSSYVGGYVLSKDNGSTYPITGTSPYTFTGLAPGVYNIKARNSDGSCVTSISPVTINAAEPTVFPFKWVPDEPYCEQD